MKRAADIASTTLDPARLRLAIEASGDIIFTTDTDGTFTYVNAEFERIYGHRSAEVVGRSTPRILTSGRAAREEYEAFWTRLKRREVVRNEFVNRTKDGRFVDIETSANPIVDRSGALVGFLAVQRDITIRKGLQAALRESERRYRALGEAAHDSIFIVNRAGEIVYANDISPLRVGMPVDEAIGQRIDRVFPPATAEAMWRELSSVFATGRRQRFEQSFAGPGGQLWLETWVVPLDWDGGDLQTVMAVARDVTERKTLERDLLQAQKMEAIGLLAGGVAHDFNNLLTAILGYCELLQAQLNDRADVLADLEEIGKAGQRAASLTRQLLAFSRKQAIDRHIVNPSVLVKDTHNMIKRLLPESILVTLDAQPDVWTVVADAGQLQQVVLNLAVNARDAMPKGGRLTIAAHNLEIDRAFAAHCDGIAPGPHVCISVCDTGCGMTADVISHAFEPFFTTKAVGQGTGLGLSTVYGIVRQNGGAVTIDSAPGVGTTVSVFVPKAHDGGALEGLPDGVDLATLAGSETILLVEDESAVRTLMQHTLETRGYRVLEARDSAEALALSAIYEATIDLLLSDVVMPGLSGPDLAQRLLAQRPAMKVLHISGFPNLLAAQGSDERRRLAFLPKPFTPGNLVKKVRECLDTRERTC